MVSYSSNDNSNARNCTTTGNQVALTNYISKCDEEFG